MGQLVVEIPQNIHRSYNVDDVAVVEQLLDELGPYSQVNGRKIIPPRRNDREEALKEVFGIWSDREESAQEIARKVRENNRRVT